MKALRPSLILIGLLCIVSVNPIHAQWELVHFPELKDFKTPDSLKDLPYQELRAVYTNNCTLWNENVNLELAEQAGLEIMRRGLEQEDSLNVGRGYLWLGNTQNNADFLLKAYVYTKDSKHKYHPTNTLYSLALHYYESGDYKKCNNYTLLYYADARLKKNKTSIYISKDMIKTLNHYWGDRNQALLVAKENFKLYKEGGVILHKSNIETEYLNYYYDIAGTYYLKGDFRNANIYLDSLYNQVNTLNNMEFLDSYLGLKGGVLFRQGKYTDALKHTNTYLNNSTPNEPYGISRSSVIKGLTLWELGLKEEAMQAFHIADSIYQETKNEYEELGEGYAKMIAYYNKQGHTTKQLEFTNKLLAFNEEITSNYLDIAPKIQRAYTVPKLLEEKEILIAQLAKNNGTKMLVINGLIGISVLLLGLGLLVLRKNYAYLSVMMSC